MQLSELGVTASKEKQFCKKGICSCYDLVRFLPRKYNDFSVVTGIMEDFDTASTIVMVNDVKLYNNGVPVIIARCTDIISGDKLNVSWFNQKYLFSKLSELKGNKVCVAGKMTYNTQYSSYNISNPIVFTKDIDEGLRIYPVYTKIAGMSEDYLVSKIIAALKNDAIQQETIPDEIVTRLNLYNTKTMLNSLHAPSTMDELCKAQARLIFDDLLHFSLRLQYAERQSSKGSPYGIRTLKISNGVIKSLPYELTDDQKSTVHEMVSCMRNGQRINALVQGDVGAGKTIVAFLMMLAAVDSGYQVALMAPTQVLARQHYNDLLQIMQPYDVEIAFLSGSQMKKKERTELLGKIKSGHVQIVIGTHAVLNRDVQFHNLALTVTDEEHKFGVMQRKALVEKAAVGVHAITMSATPIPRSLAQVVYGNSIQMYTIKTMPKGRKPIKTAINNSLSGTQKFLLRELDDGRQAYVVCPMIDKNEDMEGVKSVEEISKLYADFFEPHGYIVGVLTGQNTKDETDAIIEQFKAGNINILVATTVIEVGVNVPNASVIIIHNAERFGLSGLHQLRGRVGRGMYQSYCVLFSEDAHNERLNVLTTTTDGYKIAEEDLKLRGAGDFIGTKQSGDDKYIALMLTHPTEYAIARKTASEMLDNEYDCLMINRLFEEKTEIIDAE